MNRRINRLGRSNLEWKVGYDSLRRDRVYAGFEIHRWATCGEGKGKQIRGRWSDESRLTKDVA